MVENQESRAYALQGGTTVTSELSQGGTSASPLEIATGPIKLAMWANGAWCTLPETTPDEYLRA